MMVLLPFFFAVGMRAQTQQTGVVNNGDYVYDYDDNMKYRITEVSDDDPYKVYVALDGFIDAGDTRKDLNIKSSFISASGDNVYHYIVSTIGEGAFRGNTTIECVHVHIGCMVIGVSAFQNCTALKKVYYETASSTGGFTRSIGDYAYAGCTSLSSYEMSGDEKRIGKGAFQGCKGLKDFSIHEKVDTIGDDAFWGCTGLTAISLPATLKEIGSGCFRHCDALTTITFASGFAVDGLPSLMFSDCGNLSEVTIPSCVKTLGENCFNSCSKLSVVHLQEGLQEIGDFCFSQCAGLTKVEIPGSVEFLRRGAFQECGNLANVKFLGDHVKSIGAACFYDTQVENITLPYGLESLGYDKDGANSGNPLFSHVHDMVVPSTVQTIGKLVGSESGDNINSVKFLGSTPPELAPNCYMASDLNVYVPQGAMEAYTNKFSTTNVRSLSSAEYSFTPNAKSIYGTICVQRCGDYTEGIEKLYTVKSVKDNTVQLTEKTDGKLEPGVPYIFKKCADCTEVSVWFAGVENCETPKNDGYLKSTFTEGENVPEGAYVLQSDNKFHKVGSTPLEFAVHRAYLELPKASAPAFRIDFGGATGILRPVTTSAPAYTRLFDLSGRQATVHKGVVIKNGKKYIFR